MSANTEKPLGTLGRKYLEGAKASPPHAPNIPAPVIFIDKLASLL